MRKTFLASEEQHYGVSSRYEASIFVEVGENNTLAHNRQSLPGLICDCSSGQWIEDGRDDKEATKVKQGLRCVPLQVVQNDLSALSRALTALVLAEILRRHFTRQNHLGGSAYRSSRHLVRRSDSTLVKTATFVSPDCRLTRLQQDKRLACMDSCTIVHCLETKEICCNGIAFQIGRPAPENPDGSEQLR